MVMGMPECWSRVIDFWNWSALEGVVMMVDAAP